MPRFALLASLALAACTGDPAPLPQPDAAADVAPDVAAPPDAPQDAAAPPDLTPPADVAGPDATPPPDAGPDNGPDVTADAAPDAPRDVAGELADVAPDRPETPPADPLLEQVSAVRVTATDGTETWATPEAQSCAVTSGRVGGGAEYRRPYVLTVSFDGPLSGPVVLSVPGAGADIRATVRAGAEYLTDGASVRRVNVEVRGMASPSAPPLTVIALGCVVR